MVAVVALVVAVGILLLLGYIVHRAKPTKFKLTAGVWKILTFNVEVESEPGTSPEKPPDGRHRAMTADGPKALPPPDEPKALPVGSDGEAT